VLLTSKTRAKDAWLMSEKLFGAVGTGVSAKSPLKMCKSVTRNHKKKVINSQCCGAGRDASIIFHHLRRPLRTLEVRPTDGHACGPASAVDRGRGHRVLRPRRQLKIEAGHNEKLRLRSTLDKRTRAAVHPSTTVSVHDVTPVHTKLKCQQKGEGRE
jgi:hypothetical protein